MPSSRPYRRPPLSRFAPPLPPSENTLQPPDTLPPLDGGSQNLLNSGTNNANEKFNRNHSYSQTNPTSNRQLSDHASSSSEQQHVNPPSINQDLPLPQLQPFRPQHLQPMELPPGLPLPSFPRHRRRPPMPLLRKLLVSRIRHARMNRESRDSDSGASLRQENKPPLQTTGEKLSGDRKLGRVEREEERRLRKKRDRKKQKQEESQRKFRKKRDRKRQKREEKIKQQLREPQNAVLQKGEGSASGSQMGDRRTQSISGDGIQKRLERPTMFICKMEFENNPPDPSVKNMLLPLKRDIDDCPKGERIPLDPEDEALLHDDDDTITLTMTDDMKRKERLTDEDPSWLVKTQYSSPLSMDSTKESETEKHAKRLRESQDQDCLESPDKKERHIHDFIDSSEACKSQPVHAVNCQLNPIMATKESCIGSSSNLEKPDEFSAYSEPPVDEVEVSQIKMLGYVYIRYWFLLMLGWFSSVCFACCN